MEKGKDNEGEREKEDKLQLESFSALRKDVVNVLAFMERLKNEEDQIAVDIADQLESLKFVLAFVCMYVQLSYSNLEKFAYTMIAARQEAKDLLRSILDVVDNNIGRKYNNMNHVLPSLINNMDDCIGSCPLSKSSATITEEQLNFLLLNIHHIFEKRAFGKEICPDELLDVGKEIAQNCKGLPLVADLIAGVISRREKKKTVWLEVLNNLNSFIVSSEVEVMKVIELSYEHLPDQVKPCLLYLASRPKDTSFLTPPMIDILHPEGLVEQTDMKSVVWKK